MLEGLIRPRKDDAASSAATQKSAAQEARFNDLRRRAEALGIAVQTVKRE